MLCDDKQGRHWINLSLGNGKFHDLNGPKVSGWCGHPGSKAQWADVNGDGKADLLCDDTVGRHWVLLSNGNGTFVGKGLVLQGWCGHAGATTHYADVNGDGKADMICDDTAGRHWIRLSNGAGQFPGDLGMVKSGWCGHAGSYSSWADTNGDGKADLHCDDTHGTHWVVTSHIGEAGKASFTGPGMVKKGWCSHPGSHTTWADTNGDGSADMHCDDNAGRHWTLPVHSVQ